MGTRGLTYRIKITITKLVFNRKNKKRIQIAAPLCNIYIYI